MRADGALETYRIGPHTPTMKPEDVHLVHRIWLDMKRIEGTEDIHHSDIVTLALTRLARDYNLDREDVLKNVKKIANSSSFSASALLHSGSDVIRTRTDGAKREQPMPPMTGLK